MNPYREPAPMPRERFSRLEWQDTELITLEWARRAREEADDFYAFHDAIPSLGRHVVAWLTLA